MNIRIFPPPHIWKPIKAFCIEFLIYLFIVAASFSFVRGWLDDTHSLRTYVAALPGLAMCGIFWLLYRYFRSTDELAQRIALHALAVTCVIGLASLVISIVRSRIGGYVEFSGSTILSVMGGAFFVTTMLLTRKYR